MLVKADKRARTHLALDYMEQARLSLAVCFSCGNASRTLVTLGSLRGIRVLDVPPGGDLEARRGVTPTKHVAPRSGRTRGWW